MTQLITGHTRFLAHLGTPTHSFKAPMIYNPYFEEAGIDVAVVPMDCGPDAFGDVLRSIFRLGNIAGALVTMPHKVPVVDMLDEVSPTVRVCGACNAVKVAADGRLIGDMFDGEGFVRGVLRKGRAVAGASALVIGAGGVGSAIAASLANAGAAKVGVYDTDPDRAGGLAQRLRDAFPNTQVSVGSNDPAGWDIVVNATPLGMNQGDPMPCDTSRIAPETFVGEVVMKAEATPFLAAARANGCMTQVGTDMLFEQIPAYLEFFDLPSTTAEALRRTAKIVY
ncbi:shikimate dehydrogenase family protein [Pseudoprimorskyibacter insulae]|uniref:Shikimate dehydrogenase (NADP(+)) n=1 Tax=Pseudoprimorskyibacter insulae TaxID=1695997 RepID=A0A2R8B0T8_9RHOB|nr:NAD(P)-binding domain-containing protein [Pseudoprimorskyibacter insulae]SPF81886.1 Shikimate dehydrogenase (NADP(+)) [Pseudoprimorskyibacter insulae]